ncbi:HypC/HybG/HupF family hydrogenase formation chaperone [Rhodopirellula sp. JC639]|uniref:HypC/HybG/HupF family hydrogenase formation chaperone n=1 Tax=Stieleria mannarensis TaxID=2755585 RepID=UPI001C721603|nr:HypC/HybG/HupF family hydrogenase formation chaperone [Rhodopirellula sp. JC639]
MLKRNTLPQPRYRVMCLAVPGKVESIFEADEMTMGTVNFGGVVKEVCLALLPEIQVGDYAVVHAGFAISRVDETSAEETLRTFQALQQSPLQQSPDQH